MMDEKIKEYRGIRNLVAAKLIKDTKTELTYDTPFYLAGTSELTKETTSSSATHYYDNKPGPVVNATGADEVNVNVSALSLENIAKITGQKYDEGTGMLIEGNVRPPYMAIGYITEDTDGNETYVWRLKGKFNTPSESHASKDEGTDAKGQELTFTGTETNKKMESNDNEEGRATVVPASTCGFTEEEFFSSVKTPDDVIKRKEELKESSNKEEAQPVG